MGKILGEIEIHRARVASIANSWRSRPGIGEPAAQYGTNGADNQSYRQSAQDAQILYQKLTQEIKREEQRIAELEQVIAQGRTQLQKINGKLEKEQQAEAEERQNAETISSRVEPVKQELAHAQQRIHQNELLVARLETEQQGLMKRWTKVCREDYKNAVPNEIKEGVRERRKQLAK